MRASLIQYSALAGAATISLLALIVPALINGYPLLNVDTATYLYAGKEGFLPADRSYYYCLFIRHISLNYSLWFVVLAQALLVYSLVFIFIKKVLASSTLHHAIYATATVLILSAGTSAAVICSYITPDIFAPIGFLALSIILLFKLTRWEALLIWILFLFSVGTHLSNVPAYSLIVVLWCLWQFFAKKSARIEVIRKTLVILTASALFIPGMNFLLFQRFVLSESGNVFITGKLAQDGILQAYLKDHCPDAPPELCESRTTLPSTAVQFLWDPLSPVYKNCPEPKKRIENEPIYACFRYKNGVYGKMLWNIITDKKTGPEVLKSAIKGSFVQLACYKCQDQMLDQERKTFTSGVYDFIDFIFPNEVEMVSRSTQFNRAIDFRSFNSICLGTLLLSLVSGVVLVIRFVFLRPYFILLAFFLVSNAAVCGSLSDIAYRYQARIWWLLPFLVIVSLGKIRSLTRTGQG